MEGDPGNLARHKADHDYYRNELRKPKADVGQYTQTSILSPRQRANLLRILRRSRDGGFRIMLHSAYFRDPHLGSLSTTSGDHSDVVLCLSAQPALKKASMLVG